MSISSHVMSIRRDRLGDLQEALGLEVIVDVEMQPHLGAGAGAERAQRVAHRLQRLAVDVQLRPARRAAEAGTEADQLLAVDTAGCWSSAP